MDIVKDNAMIMLTKLKDGTLLPENLLPEMRRICITFLDDEGIRNEEIANTLHCSVSTVENDLRVIRESYGNLITSVDYKMVLSIYLRDAAHYKKKAVKEKDYRLAWQIDNDLIDRLMALGFLKRAPDELIVKTQKAEELTPEEEMAIDAVLLKVKERRQIEKAKKAGLLIEGGDKEWLAGEGNGWNGENTKNGGDNGKEK